MPTSANSGYYNPYSGPRADPNFYNPYGTSRPQPGPVPMSSRSVPAGTFYNVPNASQTVGTGGTYIPTSRLNPGVIESPFPSPTGRLGSSTGVMATGGSLGSASHAAGGGGTPAATATRIGAASATGAAVARSAGAIGSSIGGGAVAGVATGLSTGSVTRGIGAGLGAAGGAYVGGAIGGAVGSVVPGPGTAIGIGIGSTIGGGAGLALGDSIASRMPWVPKPEGSAPTEFPPDMTARERRNFCALNPSHPACQNDPGDIPPEYGNNGAIPSETVQGEGEPPFIGGQDSVLYDACEVASSCYDPYSRLVVVDRVIKSNLQGPIAVDASTIGGPIKPGYFRYDYTFKRASDGGILTFGSTQNYHSSNPLVFRRADGQPDTGGNPPGPIVEVPAPSPTRPPAPPSGKFAAPPPANPDFTPPAPYVFPNHGPAAPPRPSRPGRTDTDTEPSEPEDPRRPQTPAPPVPSQPTEPAPQPPGETLPPGHPLNNPNKDPLNPQSPENPPNWEPQITPEGNPTGIEAPEANIDNTPPTSWEAETKKGKIRYEETEDGYQIELPGKGWQIPQNPTLPQPQPEKEEQKSPSLFIPPLFVPAKVPEGGTQIQNPTDPKNFTQPQSPPPTPPTKTPTDNACRCNAAILSRFDQLEKGLGMGTAVSAGGEAASLAAILKKLQEMQQWAEKAWETTRLQKVLDALTLITVLHNASMLSRDMAETLGHVISQGLYAVGIKDENDSPLDINGIIGSTAENWIKSLIGADVYDSLRETYQKANRIVQSASAIIWTIRSITDASQDLMEWIGQNTGRIGNALKKWRVVGENAYPHMSERPQAHHRLRTRFQKYTDAIENVEDRISVYDSAISNVIEIEEETNQLVENFGRFRESVNDFAPDAPDTPASQKQDWGDNTAILQAEQDAIANSPAPEVPVSDSQKGTS